MICKVRALRIIEYVGDRQWVEMCLEKSLEGTYRVGPNRIIKCATVGNYPEILGEGIEHDTTLYNPLYSSIDQMDEKTE